MPSDQADRRTALVTGASSGIGRDLAILLAENGFNLVLAARNRPALQQLAIQCSSKYSAPARVMCEDLADPAAPGRIFGQLERDGPPIDVLVNNAGFGEVGPYASSDLPRQLAIVQVNVSAPMALTRLLLPAMIQRGWGRILNVASTAAFVPGPYLSTYYASKAFLVSHSLALAHELRHTGVKVTVICPGPTRTDFQRRAGMERAGLFRFGPMSSMKVARAGLRGLLKGRRMVVPGLLNKLGVFGSRFGPRWLAATITGKLNRVE